MTDIKVLIPNAGDHANRANYESQAFAFYSCTEHGVERWDATFDGTSWNGAWTLVIPLPTVPAFDDLTDVNLTGLANAQTIVWDDVAGEWKPADLTTNLGSLTDVDLTGIADGNILIWDDATDTWLPGDPVTSFEALSDVDLTGLADGQIAVWDETAGMWVPNDRVVAYTDLSDIDMTDLADGQVAAWDETAGKWVADTMPRRFGELLDVDLSGIVGGQVPVWDDVELLWRPGNAGSGGGGGTSDGGGALSAARFLNTVDNPVLAATETLLTYDSVEYDRGGALADLANSRFVAEQTGPHVLMATVALTEATAELRVLAKVNGVQTPVAGNFIRESVEADRSASGSIILNLIVGDIVEVFVWSVTAVTVQGLSPTWVDLAYMGDGRTNSELGGPTSFGAHVGQIAPQAVPNGGATIDMGITHRADDGFTVDLVANTVTVEEDGWYIVDAMIHLPAFNNGEWYTTVPEAGVEVDGIAAGLNKISSHLAGAAYLEGGTALTARMTNWTGGDVTTIDDPTGVQTYLRVARLGAPSGGGGGGVHIGPTQPDPAEYPIWIKTGV